MVGAIESTGCSATNSLPPIHLPTYHNMIFWARLPMILIACALGWLVFVWARILAGGAAALAALLLFTLEPNILAHSILVKTDIASSFVYLLFFFVLHEYLRQPSALRAGTLGLVLGIGLLTKMSMLSLLPVCVLCLFLRWLVPNLMPSRPEHPTMQPLQGSNVTWHSIAALTLTTLIVHTGYGFEAFRPAATASTTIGSGFWSSLAPILPPTFLSGMDIVFTVLSDGWPAFLNGEFSNDGWWQYFPTVMAIKLPLVTTSLFIAALATGFCVGVKTFKSRGSVEILLITAAVFIYLVPAIGGKVNIGIRHILPTFGPLFVLAALVMGRLFQARHIVARAVPALLVGLQFISVVTVYPDYLSYFNETVGGPQNGWYYLSDSNIDWGQDLPVLAEFVEENEIDRIRLAYFGAGSPAFYGIPFENIEVPNVFGTLDSDPLQLSPGWYAISVTWLQGTFGAERSEFFSAFRDRSPVVQLGYSIHVYRIP